MALGRRKLKTNKELTELDKLKIIVPQNPYLSQESKKEFLDKLETNKEFFGSEERFIALVNTILKNKKLCEGDINRVIKDASLLYSSFETSGYSFNYFLKLFEVNGIYEHDIYREEIISNYETVEKYFQAMNMIIHHEIALKNFSETTRLITALGIYTPNDVELNSMLSHFLTNSNFAENYQDLVDYAIENAKKRAGVYDDISDDFLAKIDSMVKQSMAAVEVYKKEEKRIEEMGKNLRILRGQSKKELEEFQEAISRIVAKLEELTETYVDKIDKEYIDKYAQLKNDYNDIIDKLLLKADVEAKRVAKEAVSKLEAIVSDLSSVKSEYQLQTEDLAELKKTATVEVKKGLKEIRELISGLGINGVEELNKLSELLKSTPEKSFIIPSQSIVTAPGGIVLPESLVDTKIPEVINSFDNSIEFKKRYKMMMDKKKRKESEGVVYNEAIDVCIYFMIRNFYPYLYGPSGAGKNYFVKQLAELFELPCLNIGYITEEYDIVGGKTANGQYSPSNFYECWLKGYIGFANEFDNSVAQASIKLNDFLDKEIGEEYSFPGLGFVKRHPNFRVIAAGNTTGMGLNRAYNARQKFDEAIQQRFKYVKFNFDDKVEKNILQNHQNWYEFAKLFREALIKSWQFQESEIEGQITTRDLTDIALEVEDGILSDEEILQYEFIEAKENDRLASIMSYMKENDDGVAKDTQQLIKKFNKMVEAKRKG